jgi:hypothetical protein
MISLLLWSHATDNLLSFNDPQASLDVTKSRNRIFNSETYLWLKNESQKARDANKWLEKNGELLFNKLHARLGKLHR